MTLNREPGATRPDDKVVFWDFDGTLAFRPGLWSGTMLDLLDDAAPGHEIDVDGLRPHLRDRFPWHHPGRPHPELNDADAWWRTIADRLAAVYLAVGVEEELAWQLAVQVRTRYLDTDAWRVFDDVRPTLGQLRSDGWRHVIVSNHVPELGDLVDALGIGDLVDHVVSSANVGYEKPHPAIFEHALRVAGHPGSVWMVGDNPNADVAGAEAMGIPAILVRRDGDGARRSEDLEGVAAMIVTG